MARVGDDRGGHVGGHPRKLLPEEWAHAPLTTDLEQTFVALTPKTRRILAGLMAEAQRDAVFAKQFRKQLIDVRRARLTDVVLKIAQ